VLDLLATSLVAVAISAPPADLALESPWFGVTLTCPADRCDAAAPFVIDEVSLDVTLATRGFSTSVVALDASVSLEEAFAARKRDLGRRFELTYTRVKPGAFAVLSGLSGDGRNVVYEKLVRGATGPVGLRAVYGAAQKQELDPVVAKLMRSFQPSPELLRLPGGKRLSAADAERRVTALPDLARLREALGEAPMAVQVTEIPMPTSRPGGKDARYRIGVGESHDERNVMLYWFQVDGYTGEILAADPLCDFSLPLAAWRRFTAAGSERCEDYQDHAR